MNIAGLGIADFEMMITSVLIRSGDKLTMQIQNVPHKVPLEFLNISALAFAPHELPPRTKEILDRNDMLVRMSELDSSKRPPPKLLPVIERAKAAYKIWLVVHRKMARSERFGIGDRIDVLWLDLLDALRKAAYAGGQDKISSLDEAIRRVDAVRFFIQIAWESELMAQSHFISLGKDIEEIGRMVGGWKRGILTKNPSPSGDGKR